MLIDNLELRRDNPYSLGVIYDAGDLEYILERPPVKYTPSIDDIYHLVVEGDNLSNLAYRYYKNSKYWWVIADANQIINPFDLDDFASLVIPDLQRVLAGIG
jgi:nucleoid-associated protein YgaU